MTRMTSEGRRVRRVVSTARGDMVIEVTADELVMRPKRSRRGEVRIAWGAVYLRALGAPMPGCRRRGSR